jgi:hypothetical protein
MRSKLLKAILIGFFFLSSAAVSSGYELKTAYATVIYEKEGLLRQFDRKVSLGSLSYLLRNRTNVTSVDEVKNKVDVLVERVEAVLDMFPGGLNFKILLLPSQEDVQKIFRRKYGRGTDYVAYYSPNEKTVYVSVNDIRIGVLAHELTHVILDNYFVVSPPEKIHEVLAQFVELHIKD